ncbi:MAG: hypothetical protein AAFR59_16490, partial [Bacteroidota bacterium]
MFLLATVIISCLSYDQTQEQTASYTNACGCHLTEEEMIRKLPILAIGDSIKICKVGTNQVAGSGLGPMTWLEYIQSEYHGGEGQIYNCHTHEYFKPKFRSRILRYADKSLYIDYRLPIDVYDTVNQKWVDLELEAYRQRIYARHDSVIYSEVTVAFDLPFQGPEAFDAALSTYETARSNENAYWLSRAIKQLFAAAINGDSLSHEKFVSIPDTFRTYYETHPSSMETYR